MENLEELRANKPNLWRLACELSDFKDLYRVFYLLLTLSEPVLKEVRP